MVAKDNDETLEEFLTKNLKEPNNRKVIMAYIKRFLEDEDLEQAYTPKLKVLMDRPHLIGLTYFPINELGPMRKGAVALSHISEVILTLKSAGLLKGSKIRGLEAENRPCIVEIGDTNLGFMIAPLYDDVVECSECGKIVEDSFSSMCRTCSKQLTEKYTLVPKKEPRAKPHNKPKTRRT